MMGYSIISNEPPPDKAPYYHISGFAIYPPSGSVLFPSRLRFSFFVVVNFSLHFGMYFTFHGVFCFMILKLFEVNVLSMK